MPFRVSSTGFGRIQIQRFTSPVLFFKIQNMLCLRPLLVLFAPDTPLGTGSWRGPCLPSAPRGSALGWPCGQGCRLALCLNSGLAQAALTVHLLCRLLCGALSPAPPNPFLKPCHLSLAPRSPDAHLALRPCLAMPLARPCLLPPPPAPSASCASFSAGLGALGPRTSLPVLMHLSSSTWAGLWRRGSLGAWGPCVEPTG